MNACGKGERRVRVPEIVESDPVAALLFCNPGPVQHLFVEGRPVVHDGHLVNLSEASMIWA